MIKNDDQWKRVRSRLEGVGSLIEETTAAYSGVERDVRLLPLWDEQQMLHAEIQEYLELRRWSLDHAVQGILSRPLLLDNIGELLAKLRIAAGLTQEEFAAELDWHQSNVSRFESENYSGQTIAKVVEYASALGVWLHVTPSMTESPTAWIAVAKLRWPATWDRRALVAVSPGFTSTDPDPTARQTLPEFRTEFSSQFRFASTAAESKHSAQMSQEFDATMAERRPHPIVARA